MNDQKPKLLPHQKLLPLPRKAETFEEFQAFITRKLSAKERRLMMFSLPATNLPVLKYRDFLPLDTDAPTHEDN